MTKEQQLRRLLDKEQERNRTQAGRVSELERELRRLRPLADVAAEQAEARRFLAAAQTRPAVSALPVPSALPRKGPGTPTLFLSDLHVNETVDARQTLSLNAFSPEQAKARLDECFRTAVDLGKNHMVRPSYEGIVVPVGGDLLDVLGGAQHLGERQASPRYVDAAAMVADLMEPGFRMLADAFGSVRSPWVTGNHARLTMAMPFQDRSAKSLDAVVYHILEGRLRKDRRFAFELAPGPKLLYQVYDHRYLLLHGDPASGMPNFGGALGGPASTIARGTVLVRSACQQFGVHFNTLVVGHFHQFMVLPGAVVNGSLKGYDEYAAGKSLPYEEPRQAFWFTHPKYGITCSWPIYVGKNEPRRAR